MTGRSGTTPQPPDERAGSASRTDQPLRVLLAEDDTEMRKMLAWSLQRGGWHVVECRDGSSFLEKLSGLNPSDDRQGFDLIVSDIRMPGINGLQVLERAKEFGGLTPVIVITAFPDDETLAEAERLGAAAVFTKPFDLDDLLAEARRVVRPDPAPAMRGRRAARDAGPVLRFPLELTLRQVPAPAPVEAFVGKVAAQLNRFSDHIVRCRVAIEETHPHRPRGHGYHVSIQVHTPGKTLVVRHDTDTGVSHENLFRAVRLAFATAGRRMKNHLRRGITSRGHQPAEASEAEDTDENHGS